MKIAAGKVDGVVKAPPREAWAFLIYGPDRGLVRERADALVTGHGVADDDPFALETLTEEALKADPASLEDAARALSLTGGARAVRLRLVGDGAAGPVVDTLNAVDAAAWEPSARLIVEAGSLTPRSKLRKAFEGAKRAAALPCYADDTKAVAEIADQALNAAGVALTNEARAMLPHRLEGDRALVRAELDKLILYAHGRGPDAPLTAEEVDALVVGAEPGDVFAVADAALSGDLAGADRAYAQARSAGATPVSVLLSLERGLLKLNGLRAAMGAGGVDSALNTAKPPVFGPARARLKAQLTAWTPTKLKDGLARVLTAERQLKSAGVADDAICGRLVLALAMTARRRP